MSDANLSLWRRHCHTNPAKTKAVSFGRKFTAINPQYQLERATAEWGPYGGNWGLRNAVYTLIRYPELVKEGKGDDATYTERELTTIALDVEFFYPLGAFPVSVDMRFASNDECRKKLMTESRSKALSMLGFNADIFAGEWDIPGHQRDMQRKFGDQNTRLQMGMEAIAQANATQLDNIKAKIVREVAAEILDALIGEQLLAKVGEKQGIINGPPTTEELLANGELEPESVGRLFDTSPQAPAYS